MKLSMKKILPIVLTASLVAACGSATAKQQTAPEKKAEAKPAATAQVHTDERKRKPNRQQRPRFTPTVPNTFPWINGAARNPWCILLAI